MGGGYLTTSAKTIMGSQSFDKKGWEVEKCTIERNRLTIIR
jgi:hypothetical protein